MKMKKRIFLIVSLFTLMICVNASMAQEQAGTLFEKALFLEESEGDLQNAIALYETIVREYSSEPETAAKAQLHIGLCYEKLGRTEAIKAYELVLDNYSGQAEQVAAARARLAVLEKEIPKGLSVVRFAGWDRPDLFIQPFELSSDRKRMLGVEMIQGQNIVLYDLETEEFSFITEYDYNFQETSVTYSPVFSPDGSEIVYCSFAFLGAEYKSSNLVVSTLDGQSRNLKEDKENYYIPTDWMPDGSAILAIGGNINPEDPLQLGLVSSGSGEFKPLVTLQGYAQVAMREYATATVSPDGHYIIFTDGATDGESDLYIVGIEGGTPRQLTDHPAVDKHPRWSPDGEHVAFLSPRHGSLAIWMMRIQDGEPVGEPFMIRDIADRSSLLNWTENGLACWEPVQINDIFLMDVDPETGEPVGDPRQVEYAHTGENVWPSWAPDGNGFAFLKGYYNPDGSSIVVSRDGFNVYPIKVDSVQAGYTIFNLRWRPDGGAIGMLSGESGGDWFFLCLDLDSGEWEVTSIPATDSIAGLHFDWTGNNRSIFLAKGGIPEYGAGIFTYDLETDEERMIYRPDPEAALFMCRSIKSSPDYQQLAFNSLDNNEMVTDIMVLNPETGESRKVVSDGGYFSWAPDGQKLIRDRALNTEGSKQVLVVFPLEGGSDKVINLSGSLPRQSEIREPDWSPDGKQILFTLQSLTSEIALHQNVIPENK
ncbi:PD40 domain-containing protein [bacterium]|nr:PD40 domain-containing protein [bacterium]